MTLVLAAFNARWTHSSLALRYLRDAAECGFARLPERSPWKGARVVLKEYDINGRPVDIARELAILKPDALGLSVYLWNAGLAARVATDLKALLPRCLVLAGGPEASYNSRWTGPESPVDIVVRGPGEAVMETLAANGFAPPGDGKRQARATGEGPVVLEDWSKEFRDIPFPYRGEDWDLLRRRYLYLESSRGCPFSCSYCLSSRSEQELAMLPVDEVMERLKTVVEHGPYLVKFVDRTFNADPARAREIWRRIILAWADSGTRFHCEVHPALLEDDDFRVLAAAPDGLFQFELGVQTVHARTRALVARWGDWEAERAGIARLAGLGTVHLHADLIAGLPGEGLADVARSLDAVLSCGADHVQLGFLKGLPGTHIMEQAAAFGLVFQREPPYEFLESADLSAADSARLSRVAQLIEGLANGGRFPRLLPGLYAKAGGPSAFYLALEAWADANGFDTRTKDREKLNRVLEDPALGL